MSNFQEFILFASIGLMIGLLLGIASDIKSIKKKLK